MQDYTAHPDGSQYTNYAASNEAPAPVYTPDGPFAPYKSAITESNTSNGEEKLEVEVDESTPNTYSYIAVVTSMLGAAIFGIDTTNFGVVQAFPGFVADWCVGKYGTEEECLSGSQDFVTGFISTRQLLLSIGSLCGALLFGPFMSTRFGPRVTVSAAGVVAVLGCLLQTWLSFKSHALFLFGTFVLGFAVGVQSFALPAYNSEVSHRSIRGSLGGLFQFNLVFFGLVSSFILWACKNATLGLLLPAIPALLITFLIWTVPESPRYLMKKKGRDAVVASLKRVRNGPVDFEANEIEEEFNQEQESAAVPYSHIVTVPGLRKRVLIAMGLQIFQQLTGVNLFLSLWGTLIPQFFPSMDSTVSSLMFNGIMLVGCVLGLLMVDSRYGGRRRQLLLASLVMFPCLALGGLSIQLNWDPTITLTLICIFGFGFQFAWGFIGWLYPSEIFSNAERYRALSLATAANWGMSSIMAEVNPYLQDWSVHGSIYIYAGFNFACFAFVFFFIKETKGIPLEEVRGLF